MLTKEDLQAITAIMKEEISTAIVASEERTKAEFEKMNANLDAVKAELKSDIAEIREDAEITRNGVNLLLDWAEKAGTMIQVPLYDEAQ